MDKINKENKKKISDQLRKDKTIAKEERKKIIIECRKKNIDRINKFIDESKKAYALKVIEIKKYGEENNSSKHDINIEIQKEKIKYKKSIQDEKNIIFFETPEVLKKTFSYQFKRWFFGIGKEFNRISWPSKNKVLINFTIIIGIVLFLSLVFLAVDYIITLI